MSVAKKLYASFGVVLALVCGVAAAAFWATASMSSSTREIANVAAVKAQAADAVSGLSSYIHESQTRFVLTRNVAYADHLADVQLFETGLAALAHVSVSARDKAYLTQIRGGFANMRRLDGILHADVAANRLALATDIVQGAANDTADDLAHAADAYRDAAEKQESAATAQFDTTRTLADWIIGLATGLAVIVALALAYLLARSITQPLGQVMQRLRSLDERDLADFTGALEAVSHGDLTVEAQPSTKPIECDRTDELGQMMQTFNNMLGKTHAGLASYNNMRRRLAGMLSEVSQTSDSVACASQQMAASSDDAGKAVGAITYAISEVSQGAELQARMIESARRTAEEVVRSISETALNARAAAELAGEARSTADEGVGAAQQATEAMHAVRDSSELVTAGIRVLAQKSLQIGAIAETITRIADQTNLLALNAAIEAARAGGQGRGFAIVADEVRKLAEESQDAAGEIAALNGQIQAETRHVVEIVEDSARRTQDGAATVEQTRSALERIGQAVSHMSAQAEQIAAAAQQVASESQQMQSDITEVASVAEQSSASSEQVSASSEETSASTQQIAASAQQLASTAEALNRLVSQFKVAA
jgi:methyl-accepting chemotaxis protein